MVTEQDCFTHNLNLSTIEKVKLLLCSIVLVPPKLCLALLVAFLIWFSSRLGLLFRNTETWSQQPLQGWRAFFQHCMWSISGYIIFYALGFRY